MQSRIDDLEDIIKILINMLEDKVPKDIIKLELRKYHYCFDCKNHYRGCRCGEDTASEYEFLELNDNYTSSEYSDNCDDESE